MQKALPIPIIDTLEEFKNHQDKAHLSAHAKVDMPIVIDFLEQYSGNKATFESYRREVERLLQWAWLIADQSVIQLKRQDILTYIEFCLNPPKTWIGMKRVPRFLEAGGERLPNPEWRPFVATHTKQDHKKGVTLNKDHYQLSQKALREIFTVLSSFYNALVLDEKISSNPVALIKQKSKYLQKRQTHSPIKRLTETQWQFCMETAHKMADDDPLKHERTLFMMSALYLMYLRISELAASERWIPQMNHFYQDSNLNWWFKTVGKGNKARDIAVSDSMLAALKRYREKSHLTQLPTPSDITPIFLKENGRGAITSTRHIRRIVQTCFDEAVLRLREAGLSHDADTLEIATVHWLRHTGISDDINKRGRPIAHVRDDAGHSSSAITDKYNDIELMERYQSAKHKEISK